MRARSSSCSTNTFQEAFRTNLKGYYASVDYDNYRTASKT